LSSFREKGPWSSPIPKNILDLSTELITKGDLATIKRLKAGVLKLALRQSESRNCGLLFVYMESGGATLLVGTMQREKQE